MDKIRFPSKIARKFWLCLSVCVMLMAIGSVGLAIDEFPDSPSPVLISEKDSTRALAVGVENYRGDLPRRSDKTFTPGADSRAVLFVTNLDLLPDEGANAIRVFVEDGRRVQYRMTVESLSPVVGRFGVYALTVKLFDEIARNGQPGLDGDVLVRLTWRGMTSNRVRLAFGEQGGGPPDDEDAVPTPVPDEKIRTPKVGNDLASNASFGDRYRFMQQATFGPSPSLDLRLRQLGIRRWIDQEMQKAYPSTRYPDLPLKSANMTDVPPNGCGTVTPNACQRDFYSMYPLQNWFYLDALYGNGQLRRRVSWSLSQIWVISGVEIQQASHQLSYIKILDKHAFGNYRDLMGEMTLSPTMGHYLDMRISTRISPNENYAREILQLFGIGLFMLNQDGTLILQGGQPVASYNQATVDNFTKVFTGWQLCQQPAPTCPNATTPTIFPNFIDPMIPIANLHDVTAKTLMNYTQVNGQAAPFVNLPAGQTAQVDLEQALDNIFYHPNVGPFVSKLLIQHLVTSDPSDAYVGRVTRVFNNDGTTGAARRNGRGNLDSVIKAILTDPEARGSVKTDPNYGKLREPVQFVTHFLKNFNVRSNTGAVCSVSVGNQTDGVINPVRTIAGNVVNGTAGMGQNVWNSPTVFNYYPPDYIVPGTDLIGPEFGIYTTGTSFARINFINQMVFGTGLIVDANTTSATYAPCGTGIDLSGLVTIAASDATGNALIEELNAKMLHGTMSTSMKNTLRTAITAVAATDSLTRVKQAVYLVATSSQYQVQR